MTGNEKLCKIYFKKQFFQNVLAFIDLFLDTIISVVSSTQIACDVMCVQYVQKQPPEVFFKKVVLKNFANTISKIFKNTYFEEHLRTTADQMICNKILLEKIRAVFRI